MWKIINNRKKNNTNGGSKEKLKKNLPTQLS